MKAFILDRYGSADKVRAADMPDPELRENDVLVQVQAAGVNLLDSKIRNGEFKLISAVSPAAHSWVMMWPGSWSGSDPECVDSSPATKSTRGRPKDRIGAFAEFICDQEDDVAIKPNSSAWKKRLPSLWSA